MKFFINIAFSLLFVASTDAATRTLNDSNSTDTPQETGDDPNNGNTCVTDGTDGKFCGTDGQYHMYSCENFYKFGPVEYTGYSDDSNDTSPELVCNDISLTPKEIGKLPGGSSVAFRCRDLTPEPIVMGWTKYCEASSSSPKKSLFTCYGFANDTDFSMFLQQVEASQLECNIGEFDETKIPAYHYFVNLGNQLGDHETFISSETREFDESKALTVMSTTFDPNSSNIGNKLFLARCIVFVGLIGFLF